MQEIISYIILGVVVLVVLYRAYRSGRKWFKGKPKSTMCDSCDKGCSACE
ncbi:MAG: hypothetical protein ACK5JS_01380 [Mangrovibacterium sp.]